MTILDALLRALVPDIEPIAGQSASACSMLSGMLNRYFAFWSVSLSCTSSPDSNSSDVASGPAGAR